MGELLIKKLASADFLKKTAAAMGQIAALRNRIAHSYGEVDPVRVVREAPTGLLIIERYLDEVASAVAAS